jgi:hypothetical protein
MKSTINAFQEKMEAWIAEMKDERKETVACQVTTSGVQGANLRGHRVRNGT